MKAPGYIFLLAEYVARMEALVTYDRIPLEVKQSMRQRAKELKQLTLEECDVDQIIRDLRKMQQFKDPLPGISKT